MTLIIYYNTQTRDLTHYIISTTNYEIFTSNGTYKKFLVLSLVTLYIYKYLECRVYVY